MVKYKIWKKLHSKCSKSFKKSFRKSSNYVCMSTTNTKLLSILMKFIKLSHEAARRHVYSPSKQHFERSTGLGSTVMIHCYSNLKLSHCSTRWKPR